ncbi:hypothetical protein [Micropruina sonneratiae]|nr:hypothetical protein [Micropruina sp. KQZ13P-5]MCW3156519.1 hypothetical protein [Micropruina sp. KQZ13P-5]
MSDALGLQYELPEVPEEEKASKISIVACTSSHASYFLCYQK